MALATSRFRQARFTAPEVRRITLAAILPLSSLSTHALYTFWLRQESSVIGNKYDCLFK
jgi:hypothetical protein